MNVCMSEKVDEYLRMSVCLENDDEQCIDVWMYLENVSGGSEDTGEAEN